MPDLEVFREDRIALGYLYENWSGGAKWRIQTISSPLSPEEMDPLLLFLSSSASLSLSLSPSILAALSSLDRIVRLRSTAVTKQRPLCVLDSRVSHVILLSSSETGPPSFPPRCPRSRANHRPRRRKMPIYYLRSFRPPYL